LPSVGDSFSHVLLSNGAEASVFQLIPGELPKLKYTEEIGKAAGELLTAMSDIKIDVTSPNPMYRDLFKAHHATTRENFFAETSRPVFDSCREAQDYLNQEIRDIEAKIDIFKTLNLPKQWIHADLHYDNCLVLDGRVTGILDFEFCVEDWRVCELAVCLSKYAGEKNAMQYFEPFVNGFVQHCQPHSQKEIDIVADLIILRILSNVVYFVGRAIAKEDGIEALTTRATNYAGRIKWIHQNRKEITDMIAKKFENKFSQIS